VYRVILAVLVAFMPTLVLAAETEENEKAAVLNVKTVPDNAEIAVNSEEVGVAPITGLILPPGEYAVSASFADRDPIDKNVILESGKTDYLYFILNEGDGKSWFSERDALIGFVLFWGITGLSFLIWFTSIDWVD
jgi:hypothetical protein